MRESLTLFFLLTSILAKSQINKNDYFRILESSDGSNKYRTELYSDIDPTWDKWEQRGYHFGFNPDLTPMYTSINGIVSTPYMVQVRGNSSEINMKRWGLHVFEGYAKDDKSRITLLLNKHIEEGKPVAELYYYGTNYNHSDSAYNWFRIGSDVRKHSYLFSRDQAIFYGSLKLTNTLTLGRIGSGDLRKDRPKGDDEKNFEESAKHVNYKSLTNSEDGTLFYDKDNDIVVIKINGEWRKLMTEPLPDSINYDF